MALRLYDPNSAPPELERRCGWRTVALNLLLVVFFGLAFWQFISGAAVHIKAHVAQSLLERAWATTLTTHEQVRPWPWADTYPVARLRVPNLGIDQIVLSGASGRTLAFGPGHSLASAPVGEGSSVLSAHRDTHFAFLQDLRFGDLVFVETPDGAEHSYIINNAEVVDTRTAKLRLNAAPSLTLVTCYPFDVIAATGPLRYVVTAVPERAFANR